MAKSLSELQAEFSKERETKEASLPKENNAVRKNANLNNSENRTSNNISDPYDRNAKNNVNSYAEEPVGFDKKKGKYGHRDDVFWMVNPKKDFQSKQKLPKEKPMFSDDGPLLTSEPINEKKVDKQPPVQSQPVQNNIEITEEEKPQKKKSRVKMASDILFYSAIAIMLVWAIGFSINGSSEKSFFGYRFFNVLTDSMDSVYPRGSLIFVKVIDTDTLEVGDDITFTVDQNTTITHRIIDVDENYEGSNLRGFQTQGVDNPAPDEDWVMAANVLGQVTSHIPLLGFILNLLSENVWIIIVLFILVVIMSFMLKLLFSDKKKSKGKYSDVIFTNPNAVQNVNNSNDINYDTNYNTNINRDKDSNSKAFSRDNQKKLKIV